MALVERPRWQRTSRWPRRIGLAALVAGCVLAGTTFAMWPRDDEPNQPDVVVVLGGVGAERVQLGMQLRERYDTPLVLSASAMGYGFNAGLRCEEDAICVRPYPHTTAGEAATIAAISETYGWDRVTVATSRFHTTRARVLFRQCFGDRVTVVGARPDQPRGIGTYVRETAGTLAALTFSRAC